MNINKVYITNNPCYKNNIKVNKTGYMQHSTGAPGVKAKSFINNWNKSSSNVAVEFIIDDTGIYQLLPLGIKSWHSGSTANNTHVGCEVCEPEECRLLDVEWIPLYRRNKNNPIWAIKRAQQELLAWGYDPNGVDGSFGPGMENAIKKFQKYNGLEIDGSIGPATLKKLQSRNGSLLKYNPENNQKYFEDVYNKAVYLCAYVMKLKDNIKSPNVVSHQEGYKLGIASNHADIGHWWPKHGKTMDDFRADVKTYLMTNILPFNDNTKPSQPSSPQIDIPSQYAKEAWEKATKKGYIDGTNPQGNVTREMLMVILDSMGRL